MNFSKMYSSLLRFRSLKLTLTVLQRVLLSKPALIRAEVLSLLSLYRTVLSSRAMFLSQVLL